MTKKTIAFLLILVSLGIYFFQVENNKNRYMICAMKPIFGEEREFISPC